ncbi:MAG: metal-dependent phosphohydrolase [Acidimicrobiia bacterium]
MLFIPDSLLARASSSLLAHHAQPWLIAHSHRTFHFGMAAVRAVDGRVDPELTFVAAMLHDVALDVVQCIDRADDPLAAFQDRGGAIAERLVTAAGRDGIDASIVHDAIALHLDLATGSDPRPEVAAVHLGALIDVLGWKRDTIPAAVIDEVLAEHPRMGMKAAVSAALASEGRRHPNSRITELIEQFSFLDLVAKAPYDE